MAQGIAAFQQLFAGADARRRLHTLALSGGLRAAGLRSVAWKVFLGLLPQGATLVEWSATLQGTRKAYEAHKEAILVDPYKGGEDKDLLTNNPLAQAEDSSWKKYFELQELQKDIQIDLERLNFDDPLFAENGDQARPMLMKDNRRWHSMHALLAGVLQALLSYCLSAPAQLTRECAEQVHTSNGCRA
jgi:hypothetical protein